MFKKYPILIKKSCGKNDDGIPKSLYLYNYWKRWSRKSLLEFSKIPPESSYSSLLHASRKHNIRFSRNVFPRRLLVNASRWCISCIFVQLARRKIEKDVAKWKCVRLLRSSEFTRKARGNKARVVVTKEVTNKSTVWTAVTALCFDSILPAALHFSPAGIAVVSPTETVVSLNLFIFPLSMSSIPFDFLDLD